MEHIKTMDFISLVRFYATVEQKKYHSRYLAKYEENIKYEKDAHDIFNEIFARIKQCPELLEPPLGDNAAPVRKLPEDDRREER